MKLEFSVQV